MSGVLAIFAHPDDESLVAGGTLAACAAAGVPVRVVSMSRGELGPVRTRPALTPPELGAVRERELRDAARELGVEAAECLAYPDSRLGAVDAVPATRELAARIAAWRPRALITFGAEGLYGHPDHLAVHALVRAAAAPAGVPWVYGATMPRDRMAELVLAMRARGLPTDLWGLHPGLFGVADEEIAVTIDVRAFVERKLRALRCHATQLGPRHLLSAIPADLAERFLGEESFVRVRPRAAAADWLTGALAGRCAA
jgi:LmbE family N-acetylglucosaminyl deacetylase